MKNAKIELPLKDKKDTNLKHKKKTEFETKEKSKLIFKENIELKTGKNIIIKNELKKDEKIPLMKYLSKLSTKEKSKIEKEKIKDSIKNITNSSYINRSPIKKVIYNMKININYWRNKYTKNIINTKEIIFKFLLFFIFPIMLSLLIILFVFIFKRENTRIKTKKENKNIINKDTYLKQEIISTKINKNKNLLNNFKIRDIPPIIAIISFIQIILSNNKLDFIQSHFSNITLKING